MSTVNTKRVKELLKSFEFQELFVEELGWERQRGSHSLAIGEDIYEVVPFAEKKGLVALVSRPVASGTFPDSATRKRIEKEVANLHFEHLIVFIDPDRTRQVWQVPRREGGKTKGHSEIPYYTGKGVEHLARRIEQISFTLGETEEVSLLEVATRVNQALLAEKVTKKFFKEFSDQRKAFVKFLDWIEDETKRDWYCSVLLNRIMFIYFLGGKGFLPGGTKFLGQNLESNANLNGPDTFYTHFLLPLSFFGLGERQGSRGRFEDQFKEVIYLNGGLFAVHSVEKELGIDKQAVAEAKFGKGTKIPDAEFKKWFAYFEKWRWTLDEDKVENDGYISPKILGHIFEKYINQKQMGAYYTKEDITGYICRNTIIPRLFDMLAETGAKGKQAVQPLPIGPHPNLMNEGRGISDGEGIDRYVYASVKQEDKLPTETDYELAQRRKRYEGILTDFDDGKIAGIDDFITYNLDIEQLAVDFVSNIQDPEVLHAFYFRGLQQITVLDPTCGSGAFLFEGLNILYPLYNTALSRMRYLVSKATGSEPDIVNWGGRLHFDDLEADESTLVDLVPEVARSIVFDELRAEVERIREHPSAEYFIKKSIIVNNLYGVDIMEEAVEICKLRLFLTLIATVERDDAKDNFGVEPLPDIDFNILAGNTLVGYTSIADIDRLWHEIEVKNSTLAFEKDHSRLKTLIAEYGKLLAAWRQQQLGEWRGARITKEQVLTAAEAVRPVLDEDIWRVYRTAGLARRTVKQKNGTPKVVDLTKEEFNRTHEPFHWLLEFPSIEAIGGFDVVVGNPPYVETTRTKNDYAVVGFSTDTCGNLYPLVFERSATILSNSGRISFIVPMAALASRRMQLLRDLLTDSFFRIHASSYAGDTHPSVLFDGVRLRLSIVNCSRAGAPSSKRLFCTIFQRWYAVERRNLFEQHFFAEAVSGPMWNLFPKISQGALSVLWNHLLSSPSFLPLRGQFGSGSGVFYQEAAQYFVKASVSTPPFSKNGETCEPPHGRFVVCDSSQAPVLVAVLSSTLFYYWYHVVSDCYHLSDAALQAFPCPNTVWQDESLRKLGLELERQLLANARTISIQTKGGDLISYAAVNFQQSKKTLVEIDKLLANHYGLGDDVLDALLNYDAKYRMGSAEEEVD